jgi:hypothetical protein
MSNYKQPEDMTLEEATAEFESLDRYFLKCKEIGQGINSKESIRFLLCADRINDLDPLAEVWSEYHYAGPATLVVAKKAQLDALKKASH